MMDPGALYEIHLDNNGDAKEDVTFQFRFKNNLKDTQLTVGGKSVSIPLINSGAMTAVNTATLNVRETYTVNMVQGNRRGGTSTAVTNSAGGANVFDKPVDNIGNKSLPDLLPTLPSISTTLLSLGVPHPAKCLSDSARRAFKSI